VTPPSITSQNATPNFQHSPVQSISRKKNKQLVVALCALLIVVVILASVVGGIYFVNMQAHSPIPTPAPPLGPASTTIEIASDFPTSGNDTTDGLPQQMGVQMAITETNNNGLLPGYTLKPIPYNDVGISNRHDPKVGAKNLNQAIADNLVAGVVGPGNSSVALKELPLANQVSLALLSPSVTFPCLTKSAADDPNCTGTNDVATQMRPSANQLTFFRLATTDDRQGKAAADLFTQHHSKVLLLKDDSDPYSFGLAQALQTEWQHMGGLVISVDLPQNVTNAQDYQNTLQAAAASPPDLIYFAGDEPNGSYVLQALSNIATLKTVPFAGGDGIMESSLLQTAANLHRNAPIYVSLPIQDPAHSGSPIGADLAINYTTNGYKDYRPYAASAYDCTMILIQAIKKALQNASTPHGTQDHAGAVQFRQAVLQALRHLPPYTGATGTHSFDANGDTTNHTVSFYQADLSTAQPNWTWLQQVKA
jgi:branched-chain amino acid transport system substrate-binding protein